MGAVRNHGNGSSDERFDANYFSIMVLLAYILNFINIWDGPFPTYGGFFDSYNCEIKKNPLSNHFYF